MLRAITPLVFSLYACGQATEDDSPPASTSEDAVMEAEPQRLVVFATASLCAPFRVLAERFERDHEGVEVELTCESGARLLARMNAGERCDVVALGDSSVMSRFAAAVYVPPGGPAELARNRIAIAVAKGNPKGVRTLADLGRPDVRLALGTRTSSIGRHSQWALSRLPERPTPAVEADTADGALAKVVAGEADAAIVYVTSFAGAADQVDRIDVPEAQNTPALYSISPAREAAAPRRAAAFQALALGPVGQGILRDAGFLPIGDK